MRQFVARAAITVLSALAAPAFAQSSTVTAALRARQRRRRRDGARQRHHHRDRQGDAQRDAGRTRRAPR